LIKLLLENKEAHLEFETRKSKSIFIVYDSFMSVLKKIITQYKHMLSNNRRLFESESETV